MIDICAACGFRIKVDSRVVARVPGPFDRDRLLSEVERAARYCSAVPAAELRGFAEIA